jgi:hypothetical protein
MAVACVSGGDHLSGKAQMVDRSDTKTKPADRPDAPVRKPWHAPQFVVTDLSSTDTMCNGGLDGGPIGSQS